MRLQFRIALAIQGIHRSRPSERPGVSCLLSSGQQFTDFFQSDGEGDFDLIFGLYTWDDFSNITISNCPTSMLIDLYCEPDSELNLPENESDEPPKDLVESQITEKRCNAERKEDQVRVHCVKSLITDILIHFSQRIQTIMCRHRGGFRLVGFEESSPDNDCASLRNDFHSTQSLFFRCIVASAPYEPNLIAE